MYLLQFGKQNYPEMACLKLQLLLKGRGEFPTPEEAQKTFTKRVFHRITKKAQKYETIGNYDCHRVLK